MRWRPRDVDDALWFGIAAVVIVVILYLSSLFYEARRHAPPRAEQTVQIKLRDLIDMVPRDSEKTAEILRKLTSIEERLAAIEQILRGQSPPRPDLPEGVQ